jgi:hypothetical protein
MRGPAVLGPEIDAVAPLQRLFICLDDAGSGADVGDRDRQSVDPLRDQILDDLHLGRGLVLDRPVIDAFDVAEFLGAHHAAVARNVEERVVGR